VHLDNGQVSTVRIPFAGAMKGSLKWILVHLVLTLLFYWKIVLTSQFSILTSEEIANQAYCWYNFVVTAGVYFTCRPADGQDRSAAAATRWIGAVKIVGHPCTVGPE
jgi:hypothetical protein